jgi:hypothetical protein
MKLMHEISQSGTRQLSGAVKTPLNIGGGTACEMAIACAYIDSVHTTVIQRIGLI